MTLFKLFSASLPPSCVISSTVPAGSDFLISSTVVRTCRATLTVLASRERETEIPTLGRPLRSEWPVKSAKPSATVATWPRRSNSLGRRRSTTCSNSAGVSRRPTRRMLWSSSTPRTLPTGALVFCARSAAVTSATEIENSRSFSAWSSMVSSRRNAPLTPTVDTPGRPRNLSAKVSSARREMSAWLCAVDDSASCITG